MKFSNPENTMILRLKWQIKAISTVLLVSHVHSISLTEVISIALYCSNDEQLIISYFTCTSHFDC